MKNTCVCFDAPVGTSASYLHSSLKLSVYDFCHFNYFFIKLSSVNHSSAITQYEKGNLRNLTVLQLAFSDVCSPCSLHICGAGVGSIQSTRLLIFHVLNPLLSILLLNYMFFYHCLTACIIDSLSNFHFKGPERYENVMEAVHVTPVVQL